MEFKRLDFAHYLVSERGLAQGTAFTYEQNLRRLERFTGHEASEIGVPELRRFLRETDYHPATKSATLVAMKAYHKFGALEGLWSLDGIMSVSGPKQTFNPQPALSLEEATTILDAASGELATRAVYLGLYAGTRISETALIRDKEWRDDRLRFKGKGSKDRDVPVHTELLARKASILSRTPTRDSLKHVVRSIAHYTGIDFTSHALRRTFAVRLSEAQVSREVIGALLGHAPLSVTERYAPVRWSELTEAMTRLSY